MMSSISDSDGPVATTEDALDARVGGRLSRDRTLQKLANRVTARSRFEAGDRTPQRGSVRSGAR
jgi:hypothetical protein